MSNTLERGRNHEIKRANNQVLMATGLPIVALAHVGYSSGPIDIPMLYTPEGSALRDASLKVDCYSNYGKIQLTDGLDKPVSYFSYSPSKELGPNYLDNTIITYSHEGAGFGTSLFQLGLLLLDQVGPQLEQPTVIGLVGDVAEKMNPRTSSRDRWSTAAVEGFGYSSRGRLFEQADIDDSSGLVFLKQIK